MKKKILRTWVEISTKAIASNVTNLKKILLPKTQFMAVVKGDAYGHGMIRTSEIILKTGVKHLAVFDFDEAVTLRMSKITSLKKASILVLRSIEEQQIKDALKNDIEVCVSTFEMLTYLKKIKLSKKLRIHLMVDTGLGRDGFLLDDSERVISLISGNKNIEIIGVMTHFSGSESRNFDSYTIMQVAFLYEWQKRLQEVGIYPMIHASATAGVFLSKEFGMDMTRFGIGMYGMWPSEETRMLDRVNTKLIPALSWKTKIVEIKELQAGSFIGYDCTLRLQRDSKIAILPVGYYDGYPRGASNKSAVLIHGKRARVLGRVMMNMIVIDVTDIPNVKLDDIVTLIGTDKVNTITADELAQISGSIHYEITTRIHPQIPRIYI